LPEGQIQEVGAINAPDPLEMASEFKFLSRRTDAVGKSFRAPPPKGRQPATSKDPMGTA
jgi:hypothetical protein